METITEENGSMVKKKVGVSKFTIKKVIDMRESGRLIYPMDKVKSLTGTVLITLENFKIIIDMEKESFMILRIKNWLISFIKMECLFSKKLNKYKCLKNNNSQH